MKHLPKSTLTEILNDPYGFTYKEMSEVIGEDKARALYAENPPLQNVGSASAAARVAL